MRIIEGRRSRRIRSYDTNIPFETCFANSTSERFSVSLAKRIIAERVDDEYRILAAVSINAIKWAIAGVYVTIPGLRPLLGSNLRIDRPCRATVRRWHCPARVRCTGAFLRRWRRRFRRRRR